MMLAMIEVTMGKWKENFSFCTWTSPGSLPNEMPSLLPSQIKRPTTIRLKPA